MKQYTSTSDIINIGKMAPTPLNMTAYAGLPQAFISGFLQGRRADLNQQKAQPVLQDSFQKKLDQNIKKTYEISDGNEKTDTSAYQPLFQRKQPLNSASRELLDNLSVNLSEASRYFSPITDNGNASFTSTPFLTGNQNSDFLQNGLPDFEDKASSEADFLQTILSPGMNMTDDQRRAKLLQDSGFLSL